MEAITFAASEMPIDAEADQEPVTTGHERSLQVAMTFRELSSSVAQMHTEVSNPNTDHSNLDRNLS